nr:hypothetical protein [uncultured Hyphomonas sp.]
MEKSKKILLTISIAIVALAAAVAYTGHKACDEQRKIDAMLDNFSMPSSYPSRSYPDIFYSFCSESDTGDCSETGFSQVRASSPQPSGNVVLNCEEEREENQGKTDAE